MQALDPDVLIDSYSDIPLAPNFQPVPAFVPSCDTPDQDSRCLLLQKAVPESFLHLFLMLAEGQNLTEWCQHKAWGRFLAYP